MFNRALKQFRKAWRLTGKHNRALKEGVAPDLPDADVLRLRDQINNCLEARGGEVSARARAAELGEAYLVLNETGRKRFLKCLAKHYDVDNEAINAAIVARQASITETETRLAEQQLRQALIPRRVRLLSQFNGLSQGVKFLVDLRAELMHWAQQEPEFRALDDDVRGLLASWFDVGFLDLERITWETPASLLEKLVGYEAVHAIRSWADLKNRLEADHRCYAFFHPRMPDEPLIFVSVALVNGIADNVQVLLDEEAPAEDPFDVDTAIFYSISNCQRGLAGVNFGSFLIKRVVDDLAREFPKLKTYATLSPIPGFRHWLDHDLESTDEQSIAAIDVQQLQSVAAVNSVSATLRTILQRPDWYKDSAITAILQPILMRLCARYLLRVKQNGRACDPVAHFHLSNGARIERINWLADTSRRGIDQSAGLMVNYRYKLDDIEKNHEAYSGNGKVVAATTVRRLLKV